MRYFLILAAAILATATPAQEVKTGNTWATIANINSADLAVAGWTLDGTTGMAAGPQTGLLVTFWRAETGAVARCVFSLVSKSGAQPFETCSVAQAAEREAQ